MASLSVTRWTRRVDGRLAYVFAQRRMGCTWWNTFPICDVSMSSGPYRYARSKSKVVRNRAEGRGKVGEKWKGMRKGMEGGEFTTVSPNRGERRLLKMQCALSILLGVINNSNKKAVLSQRWPHNAPYTWVPWKIWDSLTTPTATLPNIFHRLLFESTLWMFIQNLKSVALSVAEIIGGTQKIGLSLDTPTFPFLQNFQWAFIRIGPVNVPAKFEVRGFTCSWDKRG